MPWILATARTNCSISVSVANAAGSCFGHPAPHLPRRCAGTRERLWSPSFATREPPFYKRARIVSSKAPLRALRCSRGFLCPEKSRPKVRILIFSRCSSSLAASCPRASPYPLLWKRGQEILATKAEQKWEEEGGRRREFLDLAVDLHELLGRRPWEVDVFYVDAMKPSDDQDQGDWVGAAAARRALVAALQQQSG